MLPLLEVDSVSKSYASVQAVRDVSLTVDTGEAVSVIGPNGAGKSTLFGLVAAEHVPDGGKIAFGGLDVTAWPSSRLTRCGLSRTFQVARVFDNRTVWENLMLSSVAGSGSIYRCWDKFGQARMHRERVTSVMEQLDFGRIATSKASVLAQGDRKRLELGMALVTEPKLLLLDEPTAGMSMEDMEGTVELIREIRDERPELSILLTAHDMDVVFKISDRVVLMGNGSIVLVGTPSEVEESPIARELYLGVEA